MGVDAEMCVVCPLPFTEKEIRELSWQIGAAFGPETFYYSYPHADPPRRILALVDEFQGWDSDQRFTAPPDGALIQVNLTDRYWGPGYERGNLPQLLAITRWLEEKTGGDVWYGGDSSGCAGVKFDQKQRDLYWKHFVEKGNPYFQRSGSFRNTEAPDCPHCEHETSNTGGGAGRDFWVCCGCGWHAITEGASLKPLGWGLGSDAFFAGKTAAEVIAERDAKRRST